MSPAERAAPSTETPPPEAAETAEAAEAGEAIAPAIAPAIEALPHIDVREGLSPEEFHAEYVATSTPVVLKNEAVEWRDRWTPEMLTERFGDRPILAERNELYQNQKTKRQMPLAELLRSVQSGSLEWRVRASTAAFLEDVPELAEELEEHDFTRRYFPSPQRVMSNFWISPPSNTSVMHHDTYYENLNCMIWGHKHFVFIAPKDTRRVYPHFMNESPVNPHRPDLSLYPRFEGVPMLQGTIEAGDVLYIPLFWWHFTTAIEPCINLNIWTKAKKQDFRRVLRTMPLTHRAAYSVLYDDRRYRWFVRNMRRIHNLYVNLLPDKAKRRHRTAEAG